MYTTDYIIPFRFAFFTVLKFLMLTMEQFPQSRLSLQLVVPVRLNQQLLAMAYTVNGIR